MIRFYSVFSLAILYLTLLACSQKGKPSYLEVKASPSGGRIVAVLEKGMYEVKLTATKRNDDGQEHEVFLDFPTVKGLLELEVTDERGVKIHKGGYSKPIVISTRSPFSKFVLNFRQLEATSGNIDLYLRIKPTF